MRKYILISMVVVAIVAIAIVNVSLKSENNNLSTIQLVNVEMLAYGEGVEDCSITEYTRNAREQYVTTDVKYNGGGGFYATIAGRKVSLDARANAGGSVGIPDCTTSEGNCCAKNFIENKPKYY
jgi:hypothetical protein